MDDTHTHSHTHTHTRGKKGRAIVWPQSVVLLLLLLLPFPPKIEKREREILLADNCHNCERHILTKITCSLSPSLFYIYISHSLVSKVIQLHIALSFIEWMRSEEKGEKDGWARPVCVCQNFFLLFASSLLLSSPPPFEPFILPSPFTIISNHSQALWIHKCHAFFLSFFLPFLAVTCHLRVGSLQEISLDNCSEWQDCEQERERGGEGRERKLKTIEL